VTATPADSNTSGYAVRWDSNTSRYVITYPSREKSRSPFFLYRKQSAVEKYAADVARDSSDALSEDMTKKWEAYDRDRQSKYYQIVYLNNDNIIRTDKISKNKTFRSKQHLFPYKLIKIIFSSENVRFVNNCPIKLVLDFDVEQPYLIEYLLIHKI
jgi:hypothetical protein